LVPAGAKARNLFRFGRGAKAPLFHSSRGRAGMMSGVFDAAAGL
jgi:hypothetical protein